MLASRLSPALWLTALIVTPALRPAPAHACGGFFCSQTAPIDQTAERILFSVTEAHVTAHIQISYAGRAEDFAWVIPVMSTPEISVGSAAVFNVLAASAPRHSLQWSNEVLGCGRRGPFGSADAGAALNSGGSSGTSGVQIVDQRDVGPYATTTLAATDPDALIMWLNDNDYDQPDSAAPAIRHYVKAGMQFVALKLKRDATVGDIRPIVLDMDQGEACVPLILTRIAAVPDLPVVIFHLGQHRAVPRNWFHVEVDERKIDWLRGGSNYNTLATEAVNLAAGHGFITEYAGPAAPVSTGLFVPPAAALDELAKISNPVDAVERVLNMGWPSGSQPELLQVLRKHVPRPAEHPTPEPFFYSNIRHVQPPLMLASFDPVAFAADVRTMVWEPLDNARKTLMSQPYLTRLFTTVSPDEMNRDPFFHMNPDLPDVSNVHVATGTGRCDDGRIKDATITLSNGEKIRIGDSWDLFSPPPWQAAATEPAARHIALVGASGAPTFYSSTQALQADRLLDNTPPDDVRATPIPGDGMPTTGTLRPRAPSNLDNIPPPGWAPDNANEGDGCALAGTSDDTWFGGVLLVGLLWWRARRKAPRA